MKEAYAAVPVQGPMPGGEMVRACHDPVLEKLRKDRDLAELLRDVCDVEILPGFRPPQDEMGHLKYSIAGKTFACEGSGSEYILLEDGSVGYWGSEGQCGRIADNLKEFFELAIHCPFWKDYVCGEEYESREELRAFAGEVFEEYRESLQDDLDLCKAQRELAEKLGVELKEDVAEILMRFYRCAKRRPPLIAVYTEEDGSVHSSTGSLFDI